MTWNYLSTSLALDFLIRAVAEISRPVLDNTAIQILAEVLLAHHR